MVRISRLYMSLRKLRVAMTRTKERSWPLWGDTGDLAEYERALGDWEGEGGAPEPAEDTAASNKGRSHKEAH
jgi:hypothetical protein